MLPLFPQNTNFKKEQPTQLLTSAYLLSFTEKVEKMYWKIYIK